jgi:hypothetical protein
MAEVAFMPAGSLNLGDEVTEGGIFLESAGLPPPPVAWRRERRASGGLRRIERL